MSQSAPKEIVLVVEDEPLLRIGATSMLEEAGFDVVEVGSAGEAVTVLEARTDIHLVFSDIDMPRGMDGMKLAALIRDRWPPIEIILTSGKGPPDTSGLPARCVFLSKPYKATDVVTTLRSFAKSH